MRKIYYGFLFVVSFLMIGVVEARTPFGSDKNSESALKTLNRYTGVVTFNLETNDPIIESIYRVGINRVVIGVNQSFANSETTTREIAAELCLIYKNEESVFVIFHKMQKINNKYLPMVITPATVLYIGCKTVPQELSTDHYFYSR